MKKSSGRETKTYRIVPFIYVMVCSLMFHPRWIPNPQGS